MSLPIALQLYTVRDLTSRDFLGTMEKVAEIGYNGVEFAGFGDISAAKMRTALDKLGLKAVGSHTRMELLVKDLDAVINYNLEIGNKHVICPANRYTSKEDVYNSAKLFNEIGYKCRAKGLEFGYHNHEWEFTKYDGEYGLDILYKETDPKNMIAEIDVCWVTYSGLNAPDYLRKYKGRCPLVHLKDILNRDVRGAFTEVGDGIVDMPGVIKASNDIGAEWLIVEQDSSSYPTLESAKISFENVKKMQI